MTGRTILAGLAAFLAMVGIGWIIPGLLSRDFDRQGLGPTVAVTALAVVLIRLVALLGDGFLW